VLDGMANNENDGIRIIFLVVELVETTTLINPVVELVETTTVINQVVERLLVSLSNQVETTAMISGG